jgi:hypothetical protein
MSRKLILILIFLTPVSCFAKQGTTRYFENASYSDIFISTKNADIFVTSAGEDGQSSVNWKESYCTLALTRPSAGVTEIFVTPNKQHVFFKKILGVAQAKCKIRLELAPEKKLYASSETGSIRMRDAALKNARLYTEQGIIEIQNYKGSLSAETLTGRITVKNADAQELILKSANGTVNAACKARSADILNTSGPSRLQGSVQVLRFYSSEGNLYAKWDELPLEPLQISARSFAGDIRIILPPKTNSDSAKNTINLRSFYGKAEIIE